MTALPIHARLNEIRMGFMVLTRLPMGHIGGEVPSMAASAWSWPLVGAVVGAVAAVVFLAAQGVGLTPVLAAALAVMAGVLATGGLHEDGLADLADGFGGGRDKAKVLDIMRDSRIGSYGALALGFSLLIRVLALASLPPCIAAMALVGLGAASRAGLPLALRVMPSARADGLGRATSGVSAASAFVALGVGAAGLLSLGLGAAVIAAAAIAASSLALAIWAKARIGGQTGDVLGAMAQVGEIAGWLAVSAVLAAN